jgi:UrcA family protein
MQKSLIATAALFAVFAANTATAGVIPQQAIQRTARVEVSLKGLNLRDAAQADEAYKRLQRAAIAACASSFEFTRREVRRDRACAREALNTAVATLNRPTLTGRHEGERAQNRS